MQNRKFMVDRKIHGCFRLTNHIPGHSCPQQWANFGASRFALNVARIMLLPDRNVRAPLALPSPSPWGEGWDEGELCFRHLPLLSSFSPVSSVRNHIVTAKDSATAPHDKNPDCPTHYCPGTESNSSQPYSFQVPSNPSGQTTVPRRTSNRHPPNN